MSHCLSRFSATALVATLCLMLSACGFQLRGTADIAEPLRQLSLVIPAKNRSQLETQLQRQLRANGIELGASNGYVMEIVSEDRSRREASLSARANVDEYELTTKIGLLVSNPAGEIVLERQLIAERIYDYDSDTETASSVQEEQLYIEMDRQLASQIIRLYSSLKPAR